MRLRYSLTRLDNFRACIRAIVFQRMMLFFMCAICAFTGWTAFTAPEYQQHSTGFRITLATVSACMALGVGMAAGGLVLVIQSFLQNGTGIICEHTLEIIDEGLVETTEVNRNVSNWRTGFVVRETKNFAYIFITAGNAYIIPKGRRALEGDVGDFLRAFRAKMEANERSE